MYIPLDQLWLWLLFMLAITTHTFIMLLYVMSIRRNVRRMSIIMQMQNRCPHGHQDWDNCPVCGH